jgi:hypothetical protein
VFVEYHLVEKQQEALGDVLQRVASALPAAAVWQQLGRREDEPR